MGTDFFDGLVKTFSKTTKELGKTTRIRCPRRADDRGTEDKK